MAPAPDRHKDPLFHSRMFRPLAGDSANLKPFLKENLPLMSILVVGSVAFDSVQTPFGKAEEVLGGSASYFSLAASFFAPVQLVAVVGEDFPEEHLRLFRDFSIDTGGLQKVPGKTFRWRGEYGFALNEARTLDTQLNVFERFRPRIPDPYRQSDCVFLGNIDPVLQAGVLSQVENPRFVACDTMNYWIESKPDQLRETLRAGGYPDHQRRRSPDADRGAQSDQSGPAHCRVGPGTLVVKRENMEWPCTTADPFSAPRPSRWRKSLTPPAPETVLPVGWWATWRDPNG